MSYVRCGSCSKRKNMTWTFLEVWKNLHRYCGPFCRQGCQIRLLNLLTVWLRIYFQYGASFPVISFSVPCWFSALSSVLFMMKHFLTLRLSKPIMSIFVFFIRSLHMPVFAFRNRRRNRLNRSRHRNRPNRNHLSCNRLNRNCLNRNNLNRNPLNRNLHLHS